MAMGKRQVERQQELWIAPEFPAPYARIAPECPFSSPSAYYTYPMAAVFTHPWGLRTIRGANSALSGTPPALASARTACPLRTAQAAMRHSSLDLTMNVCTDPTLLDVAGAMEALPELGLHVAVRPVRMPSPHLAPSGKHVTAARWMAEHVRRSPDPRSARPHDLWAWVWGGRGERLNLSVPWLH